MRFFKQFTIIITISFLAELLHALVPLPIPASIYGLLLMLTALITGIVKLERVRNAAKFLIEIMPLMFIPAGVGLLSSAAALHQMLLPVLVITPVTTILVMLVSGRVTQAVIRREKKRKNQRTAHE